MHFPVILGALLPLAVLANPVPGDLKKRVEATRITWYDVSAGTTACGGTYSNSDAVVALASSEYASGANCGKQISITVNDQTVDATVVDLCPGCPSGGLDLSEGLFSQVGSLDTGVLSGSWEFA
ncbi:hypothetical protein ACEPAF_4270 [Sanghuangporus sanghuang]|uniref:RlpA-like protein double-psi beta-barrel domain-containing protein n=1 Tax=Sanghuangporus baumii TaxID=108892 RepID=A0A9Q5I687_SANBA|nr:hypothetical protein A7U60_g756 [Sanghuangporus baumii]